MRRALLAFLWLAGPAAAAERALVVSPAADAVSVTIYRDPERGADQAMELDYLRGYALVTETRTVDLPAGPAEVRFEGVAGSLIAASVLVTGLPGGPGEKNRDARLLSPGALAAGALGRRVGLRRTDRATGRVREQEAVIRAAPDGVILQTVDGVEALRCSGLPETLVYDAIPPGVSARPTLAVTAAADRPQRAAVKLSYLATEFDWQANYVAEVAEDGRTLDLFAWLTLANGTGESFADARTQAIAGEPNREEDGGEPAPEAPLLQLSCWPQGSTSDVSGDMLPPPPAPPGVELNQMSVAEEIVVTGTLSERLASAPAMVASQEELGDLKLYRVPEPVTVAANSQKQVALLSRARVPFERLYSGDVMLRGVDEPEPLNILLRMENEAARGLGLPLPAGGLALFERVGERRILAGETTMPDRAVGETVEFTVGEASDVQVEQRMLSPDADDPYRPTRFEIVLTNATPVPAPVELKLRRFGDFAVRSPSRKLATEDGRLVWRATVPANGRATLAYTAVRERSSEEPED